MAKNKTITTYKLEIPGFSPCTFDDKRLLLDEIDMMIDEIEENDETYTPLILACKLKLSDYVKI